MKMLETEFIHDILLKCRFTSVYTIKNDTLTLCISITRYPGLDVKVALDGYLHILVWYSIHFQNILILCRIYVRLEHKISTFLLALKTQLHKHFPIDSVVCSVLSARIHEVITF